jgi:hypothetical protein
VPTSMDALGSPQIFVTGAGFRSRIPQLRYRMITNNSNSISSDTPNVTPYLVIWVSCEQQLVGVR